ncbi:hypothetical protein BKA63DRAFT_248603 [Paraphoma chrysanthemicola]|nr:hypothetical protein BKA63DRAFT_248603 [Paraphoma chrysanthemicola]
MIYTLFTFWAICLAILTTTTATPLTNRAPPPEKPDPGNRRRGVAFNNPAYVKYFSQFSNSHIKWAYNWAGDSPDVGLEFIPMLWSNRNEHTSGWFANVRKACGVIVQNPTHLLGFNEPDMCAHGAGGSCMSVTDAVRTWRTHMDPTKDYKDLIYLGSPAVTNSGDPDKGLNWLREFLKQCSGCKIDFICIHWYSEASATQYFKQHVTAARALAGGRPIWITEFSATGTESQVKKFMDEVIPWLDEQPDVHRYAYFMAAPGLLVNPLGNGLSEVGRHYATWTKP